MMRRILISIAVLAVPLALPGMASASAAAPSGFSTNFPNIQYAGYAAAVPVNSYTNVAGGFNVPKIDCFARPQYSEVAFWVGVANNDTKGTDITQAGVVAACSNGDPGYLMWWEDEGRSAAQGGGQPVPLLQAKLSAACKARGPYGADDAWETPYNVVYLYRHGCTRAVNPGDQFFVNLATNNGTSDFVINNDTSGYAAVITTAFSNHGHGRAEWIMEKSVYYPVPAFSPVTFNECWALAGLNNANNPKPVSYYPDTKFVLNSPAITPGPLSPDPTSNGHADDFTINNI